MTTHELLAAQETVSTPDQTPREPVITAHNLTRFYRGKPAVNQLHLCIPRGSVFALLGRNGSGKTTTIRMLLGLEQPSYGSSAVFGCDSRELTAAVRGRIGYITESHYVFRRDRIDACARYQAGTFPVWNQKLFNNVIDHYRLDPAQRVRSLSRGQRAGLCLALTVATEPELLILDDPSLGMDPVAQRDLLEAMLAVATDGNRTILFSSHQLADVERVADHLAILDAGVLRVHASADEFRERVTQWELTFSQPCDTAKIQSLPGLLRIRELDDVLRITVANTDEATIQKHFAETAIVTATQKPITLDQAVIDFLNPGLPSIPLMRSTIAPHR